MKSRVLHGIVPLALVGLIGAIWPVSGALAGLDVDLSASLKIGDDTDVFLSVSTRYFDRDRGDVEQWSGQCKNPDDLAVLLFLSKQSGKSPLYILKLRRGGSSWWEIGLELGVDADVWFVPVKRDPGPPYGNAYGHWRKHRQDRHHALVLTDDDVRNLVAVRVLHDYYGVDVTVAMEWRSSGRDLRTIAAGEYRKRHGKGPQVAKTDKPEGKGKKKGRGR
jgi:hypothetical protein